MKKCILIPDSFKGTLTAGQVCDIEAEAVRRVFPDCNVIKAPIADGGEGTADCFLQSLSCEKVETTVTGAFGSPQSVYYAKSGETAIVEMAMCAGLPAAMGHENPEIATTYGVGEMLIHAINNGCKRLVLGLGGSCTNDAGAGMAAAMGVRFHRKDGECFIPTGKSLCEIAEIDTSQALRKLKGCTLTAMCDVNNPLFGESGAAYVFAPQKGADSAMTTRLDEALRHFDTMMQKSLKKSVAYEAGAGAAGGMGAGILGLLNGRLESGIKTVLGMIAFDTMLKGCDLVITGEGCLDEQSLHGKAIDGVCAAARAKQIPVIVIAGGIKVSPRRLAEVGVTAAFSINRMAESFVTASQKSEENLSFTTENIMRLWENAQALHA